MTSGGQRYELARVQPVSASSKAVDMPKALAQGSETRNKQQIEELARFKAPLRNFLKDGPKGLNSVGEFLRSQPGFEEKFTALRLGRTRADRPGGMRLAAEAMGFKVSGEGKGPPTVSLRRTRLTGKQKA